MENKSNTIEVGFADIFAAVKRKWALILGVVFITTVISAVAGYFYTKNADYTAHASADEFLPIVILENQTYQEQFDTLLQSFTERKRYASVLLKFAPDDANTALMQAKQDLLYLQSTLLRKLDLKLKLNKAVPPKQKEERVQTLTLQVEDLKQKLHQSKADMQVLHGLVPPMPADRTSMEQYSSLLLSAAQSGKYQRELSAAMQQLEYLTTTPASELENQYRTIQSELNTVKEELLRISDIIYAEAQKTAEAKAWNIIAGYGVNNREREEYSVEVFTGHYKDTAKSQWLAVTVTGAMIGFVLSCFGAIVLSRKENINQ